MDVTEKSIVVACQDAKALYIRLNSNTGDGEYSNTAVFEYYNSRIT